MMGRTRLHEGMALAALPRHAFCSKSYCVIKGISAQSTDLLVGFWSIQNDEECKRLVEGKKNHDARKEVAQITCNTNIAQMLTRQKPSFQI